MHILHTSLNFFIIPCCKSCLSGTSATTANCRLSLAKHTHTDKHTPVISPLTTCRYSFTHSLVHLFIGISSIRGLEQQQPLCIPLCAPHLKEKERNCNVSICIELSFYLLLLMLLLENWPINHGGADFPCLLHCELVSAKWSVSFRLKNCASLFEVFAPSERDLQCVKEMQIFFRCRFVGFCASWDEMQELTWFGVISPPLSLEDHFFWLFWQLTFQC